MGIVKTLGIIGIGAWAVGKASQLFAAQRASEKIDVIISGERVGFNYQGVPVTMSYIIKNPTKARMEMTSPLIKFRVGGTHLASSTLSVDDIPQENRSSAGRIKIEPFAQTGKITSTILVPYASILKLGLAFLNKFKDGGQKVQIQVETNAQVYLGLINFAYDDIQNMEI